MTKLENNSKGKIDLLLLETGLNYVYSEVLQDLDNLLKDYKRKNKLE